MLQISTRTNEGARTPIGPEIHITFYGPRGGCHAVEILSIPEATHLCDQIIEAINSLPTPRA